MNGPTSRGRQLKESGMGFVEMILILLVIGILGFTGWFVWHSQRDDVESVVNTYAECVKAKESKIQETYPEVCVTSDGERFTNPDQKVADTSATNYLAITEWGVKLSFEDAEKVEYTISAKDADQPYAAFSLKETVANVCRSLGVGLTRSTTSDVPGNATKVGSYYYSLSGGPGACTDDPGGPNGSINTLRVKIDSQELPSAKIEAL